MKDLIKEQIIELGSRFYVKDNGKHSFKNGDLDEIAENVIKIFAIHGVTQRSELLLQAYKEGFNAATESLQQANINIQEKNW